MIERVHRKSMMLIMMISGAKTVNMMMVRVMVMLMIRIVWSLAKLAPSPLGIRSRTRRGGQK